MHEAPGIRTPTGTHITLHTSDVTATIATVGAALRSVVIDGVEVVPDYPASMGTYKCAGIALFPWPNRIRDGKWPGGQLWITEPERNTALHGLLQYAEYDIVQQSETSVTLCAEIFPQLGYDYWLQATVQYSIRANGVDVRQTLTNLGEASAPFGIGSHPYFTINDPKHPVDAAEILVRIPAPQYYTVDDRLLVTGIANVAGTEADLREFRPLGELTLDTGYKVGEVAAGKKFESVLKSPVGTVGIWQDSSCGYVQVFTTQEFPGVNRPVPAIAIEPQTCATDAFNSGDGLQYLEPGATAETNWGVTFAR